MAERSRVLSVASAVALLAVVVAVAAGALTQARDLSLANHDVGWFLHAGRVWLEGGKIGVDIIDTNPPLVIWLSGLEVLVARTFGASPFVVHALVTSAIGLLGVGLAVRALARAGAAREVLALWAPITLTVATVLSGYGFGQREHWLALLLLPYAGWALIPRERSLERALAGLCAALAVALKPHYVLALLLIELFRLLALKSVRQLVRVESLCALACAPLYLLAIAWSAPSFWTDVQDTLAVYAAYGHEVPLWSEHTRLALCALVLAAPVGLLRPRTVAPGLLAALALCGVVAAWAQHKDFAYHHIPTDVFAGAALALALALLLARVARRPGVQLGLLAVVTAGCLGVLRGMPRTLHESELRSALDEAIQRFAPDGRVFVFSTSAGAAFPTVTMAGARSLSPYSCLWTIAGNYTLKKRMARPFRYRSLEEMPPVERRAVENVVAVLVRERPSLLVFDVRPVKQAFGPTAFDLQRYFEAHPDFVALLGSYRSLARDPIFEYYGLRGE